MYILASGTNAHGRCGKLDLEPLEACMILISTMATEYSNCTNEFHKDFWKRSTWPVTR